ncbi:uncharacterized protein LOC114934559 isoform X2 [Nylanderia fulva]|uniref:uncharacterized protein LOC114934559 isoform X2 n=1 Tax=Nylanderia fulva TaxID=613905 RepID=UPI0010FB644E|nr:uncharacterized protein LOC114934559 isoform X2 [Nylanderia fulva]
MLTRRFCEFRLKMYQKKPITISNKIIIEKIDEEESDTQIGEPPWIGEEKINELMNLTFYKPEQYDCYKNNITRIKNVLNFLVEQSTYEDVKVYLMKHNFLDIAIYLLQKKRHYKIIMNILKITIKLCYNNEIINIISKNKVFVRTILSFLKNCYKETIIITVIQLLQLATYEIYRNSESDWIVHFKECIFFASRMMFLLQFGVMIMRLIGSMFSINLPDETNFLEQLFDLDKLFHLLLLSYLYRTRTIFEITESNLSEWIKLWLRRIDMRQNRRDTDVNEFITKHIGTYRQFFHTWHLNKASTCGNKNIRVYNNEPDSHYTHELTEIDLEPIKLLYGILNMLFKLRYIPKTKTYGGIINFLNGIFLTILVILNRGELYYGENEIHFQTFKKLLYHYWLHIIAHYTCEQIGHILKNLIQSTIVKVDDVLEYLMNLVRSDYNVTFQMRKKVEKAIIVFNQNS